MQNRSQPFNDEILLFISLYTTNEKQIKHVKPIEHLGNNKKKKHFIEMFTIKVYGGKSTATITFSKNAFSNCGQLESRSQSVTTFGVRVFC